MNHIKLRIIILLILISYMPGKVGADPFYIGWHGVVEENIPYVADLGTNVVMNYWANADTSRILKYLNQAHLYKQKVILDIGQMDLNELQIILRADQILRHPSLWGWYLADEPELKMSSLFSENTLQEKYEKIKEKTPEKPIMPVINNVSKFENKYSNWADFCDGLMLDTYPLRVDTPLYPPSYPTGINRSLDYNRHVDDLLSAAPQPYHWFLPQSFGYRKNNLQGEVAVNGTWYRDSALKIENTECVLKSRTFENTDTGFEITFSAMQEDYGDFGLQFGQSSSQKTWKDDGNAVIFSTTPDGVYISIFEDRLPKMNREKIIEKHDLISFDPTKRFVKIRIILTQNDQLRVVFLRHEYLQPKYRSESWEFSYRFPIDVDFKLPFNTGYVGLISRNSTLLVKDFEIYDTAWAPSDQVPIFKANFSNEPSRDWTAGVKASFTEPWFYRTPTSEEFNYMCYASIIHGANGLLFWALYRSNPESRDVVAEFIGHFNRYELGNILPNRQRNPQVDCRNPKIQFMVCEHPTDSQRQYLLAINTGNEPDNVVFNLENSPTLLDDISPLSSARGTLELSDRTLMDRFNVLAVKIYRIQYTR